MPKELHISSNNTQKCTISNMFDDVFDTCQKLLKREKLFASCQQQ